MINAQVSGCYSYNVALLSHTTQILRNGARWIYPDSKVYAAVDAELNKEFPMSGNSGGDCKNCCYKKDLVDIDTNITAFEDKTEFVVVKVRVTVTVHVQANAWICFKLLNAQFLGSIDMKNPIKYYRWLGILLCVLILIAAFTVFIHPNFNSDFNQIKIGASKDQVVLLVGKPTDSFTNLFISLKYGGREVWAYPQHGFFQGRLIPFMIKGEVFPGGLFLPPTNDYLVIFDDKAKVAEIRKPNSQKP